MESVVPAIFVPLRTNITHSAAIPHDRTQRLKLIIESIDLQREGVRENMIHMFEREMRRYRMEALKYEVEHGQEDVKTGFHPDEADALIQSMAVPMDPRVDYNVKELLPPDLSRLPPDKVTMRESVARELLMMVEKALVQLKGYGAHIDKIKQEYLNRLEKEIVRFDGAGKTPNERTRP